MFDDVHMTIKTYFIASFITFDNFHYKKFKKNSVSKLINILPITNLTPILTLFNTVGTQTKHNDAK